MGFSKSKLAAYHHGANEGVTDGNEGAGLLSEGGRDREPAKAAIKEGNVGT